MVERKHGHILDVTRTIILQIHVPKYLWFEVVFTNSYLINRMPFALLSGEVRLRCLQSENKLFSLPPRVFGCVAFVQIYL